MNPTLAWAHDTGADLAKAANFTILRQNPYTVDARRLNEIEVIGTVYGGRRFSAVTS
jgi:predicted amidohydrolase YtcJ